MIKSVSGSRPLSIICIIVSYRLDVFKKKTWVSGSYTSLLQSCRRNILKMLWILITVFPTPRTEGLVNWDGYHMFLAHGRGSTKSSK